MSTSPLLLIELKADRCAKKVEVRLLWFWESERRRAYAVMGCMLFVNEKVTPVTILTVNVLSLFFFINSHRLNNSIRLSNSPLAIRCVWSVEGISYSNNWWTVQVLQLWPQLLALANTNTHLRGLFLDFYLTRLTLTYPISESCQLNLLRVDRHQEHF